MRGSNRVIISSGAAAESENTQAARAEVQEMIDALASRIASSAVHPTAIRPVQKPRMANLKDAFNPLSGYPRRPGEFPRAVVRPVPGLKPGELIWAAKIWLDPCCPAIVNGCWVTKVSASKDEVFWWAQKTTEEFREIFAFHKTGELGVAGRRWAPQW